jgi:hypothetical protein
MNEMTFTAERLTRQRDAALIAEIERRRSVADHGTRIVKARRAGGVLRRAAALLRRRRPGPRRLGPTAAV